MLNLCPSFLHHLHPPICDLVELLLLLLEQGRQDSPVGPGDKQYIIRLLAWYLWCVVGIVLVVPGLVGVGCLRPPGLLHVVLVVLEPVIFA